MNWFTQFYFHTFYLIIYFFIYGSSISYQLLLRGPAAKISKNHNHLIPSLKLARDGVCLTSRSRYKFKSITCKNYWPGIFKINKPFLQLRLRDSSLKICLPFICIGENYNERYQVCNQWRHDDIIENLNWKQQFFNFTRNFALWCSKVEISTKCENGIRVLDNNNQTNGHVITICDIKWCNLARNLLWSDDCSVASNYK